MIGDHHGDSSPFYSLTLDHALYNVEAMSGKPFAVGANRPPYRC